ncbi:MAG: hypothetical protein Rubg2KO_08880 [Rubricoccaceae bacterium]
MRAGIGHVELANEGCSVAVLRVEGRRQLVKAVGGAGSEEDAMPRASEGVRGSGTDPGGGTSNESDRTIRHETWWDERQRPNIATPACFWRRVTQV